MGDDEKTIIRLTKRLRDSQKVISSFKNVSSSSKVDQAKELRHSFRRRVNELWSEHEAKSILDKEAGSWMPTREDRHTEHKSQRGCCSSSSNTAAEPDWLWREEVKNVEGHMGTGVAEILVGVRNLFYLQISNGLFLFIFICLPYFVERNFLDRWQHDVRVHRPFVCAAVHCRCSCTCLRRAL